MKWQMSHKLEKLLLLPEWSLKVKDGEACLALRVHIPLAQLRTEI